MSDRRYFYCLRHGTVEEAAGCRAADRLGPYPDRASAAHALETARARTEAADAEDRERAREEDGDEP